MKTLEETRKALNKIREIVDADVISQDIVVIQDKLIALTQLTGLSAEANASAKKILHKKELEILRSMEDSNDQPSVKIKRLNAECFEEHALLEYADRLNAGLVHCLEGLRTYISLYKTELSNQLIK